MMNTSFSEETGGALAVPVTVFLYRDMNNPQYTQDDAFGKLHAKEEKPSSEVPSAQEIADLLDGARAEAIAETETRLKLAFDTRIEAAVLKIRQAIDQFATEQKDYFGRVESEIVQLALAIAAKILHRQAQIDPMLVAALVRVAVDKLRDGSSVAVRVSPQEAPKWRAYLADPLHGLTLQIVEDALLGVNDCILETDLGSANFSIDAQLKEVEQGFFDLLAQRPVAG